MLSPCQPAIKLLHVSSILDDSSFGVGTSVLGLAASQQQIGLNVQIWTHDDEHEQRRLEARFQLRANSMISFPTIGPKALGFSPTMEHRISSTDSACDILHQHGIWTMGSRVTNRWRRCSHKATVISTHGSLEPWALKKSAWKKHLALKMYEESNLRNTSCFHALSPREAQSIRNLGLEVPIAVIPNGIHSSWLTKWGDTEQFRQKNEIPVDKRIVLFLGRIAPIKGLPMLLEGLESLRSQFREWILIIAGVDQFNHQSELAEQVDRLNLGGLVRFIGPQYGQDKIDALSAAELFVLPSFSEASPISILESMAVGVPVLTTRAAAWEMLNDKQCGWCTDISQEGIALGLSQALRQSPEVLRQKGAGSKALVAEQFTWERIANCTADLYKWVLDEGSMPSFVFGGSVVY